MVPDHTYWYKQTAEKPLFPDLVWSRPEHRSQAGKLLIIGGNVHGFAAPAEAFSQAQKAGIGSARVLLPDSLYRTVGKLFPAAEFAPSTPSGSFARTALAEALALAHWADAVLLAGDIGRNSETAIFIEAFLQKYSGPVIISKDAAEYCLTPNALCADRADTTLVLSFAQLQKLGSASRFATAFTFEMDLLHLVEALHRFTEQHAVYLLTKRQDILFVAAHGQVSTTKQATDTPVWRTTTSAAAATWWLQNQAKPFEALTTSVVG